MTSPSRKAIFKQPVPVRMLMSDGRILRAHFTRFGNLHWDDKPGRKAMVATIEYVEDREVYGFPLPPQPPQSPPHTPATVGYSTITSSPRLIRDEETGEISIDWPGYGAGVADDTPPPTTKHKSGFVEDPAFRARLQSIMTDNMYDRWVKGRKRGKLDMNRLYKGMTGSSTLFTKREERKGKRYYIMLVVDVSGSMEGSKVVEAAKTACYLGQHFEKLNIHLGILSFNHYIQLHKDFTEKFDRKDWKRLYSKLINRASDGGNSCNHDYDAMAKAYDLLRRQDDGTKLMVLISDGHPATCFTGNNATPYKKAGEPKYTQHYDGSKGRISRGQKDAKHRLRKLVHDNKRHVESVAIGIHTDSDQVPDHIRADSIDQLKPLLLDVLRRKIRRGV